MLILYSTENLETRRNLAFQNYFNKFENSMILNIPVEVSFNKISSNSKFFNIPLVLILKIKANIKLIYKLRKIQEIEKIIVLFPGIIDVIFLILFAREHRNKIMYDYFISFYQTIITDRKIFISRISKSCIFHLEKIFVKIPETLIVETDPIKNHILEFFNQNLKIVTLLTPTNEEVFNSKLIPQTSTKNIDFIYWGTFINLHGLEILLKAASANNDKYSIYLLGDGQEYGYIKELSKELNLKNITFDKTIFSKENKFEYFYSILSRAKFAIGALSDSEKNNIVIPSKVLEAAAMKIPILTFESLCVDFYNMKNNAHYINTPLVESTANMMKTLIENQDTNSKKIINNSYNWFQSYGTYDQFNKKLSSLVKSMNM
tara:strand:- start:10800 stop:11924 length:1125 start_codon:yes stop_codon:yes gene_type:complete